MKLIINFRSKMIWMEKQLESLTELVKELTRERTLNEQRLLTRTDMNRGIWTRAIRLVYRMNIKRKKSVSDNNQS